MSKSSEMMIVEQRPKEKLVAVPGKHINEQANREQFLHDETLIGFQSVLRESGHW